MDVHRKLDELVALVEGARAMPMSASCVVNRAEILALLDDLRKHLPGQLAEAQQVVAERNAVIEDGRREAQRLIEEGRAERSRMLATSPDAREAVAEAERLRARSLGEIEAMRAEVDEYIDSKLANFEVVLTRTMTAVQRGRERLRGGHHADELRRDQDVDGPQPTSAADGAYDSPGLAAATGFDTEPASSGGQNGFAAEPQQPAAFAGPGFVTGEYPSVDAPSGVYLGPDHPSGEYAGAGYPSGQYGLSEHPSGEFADAGATGSYAGYPRASDYPGSVDYPQPADYSLPGYPDTGEHPSVEMANPASFGSVDSSVDDHARYPAYPHYSGYQGYGDR